MKATSAGGTPGTAGAGAAPTVALVAVGDPAAESTWSGVTAGVVGGLRELGVDVRAVDLSLSGTLEQGLRVAGAARTRNRYDAEAAALTSRVRSALAARRLPRVDAAIQIGTTFALPHGTRYVTLEDMTLVQATAEHPVFSRMTEGVVASWERRRAEVYRRALMCSAASGWTASSLRDDYGLDPQRVAVVGFGANHTVSVAERDWSAPRFLFIGLDWERKGGPLVLRAFARLREHMPSATLDLVGGHPPLSAAGVTGHGVRSMARATDRKLVAELLSRATCFVMPSRIEPFGIAYVEAAAAGLPSIASSVGGPRDVIGSNGGVVVGPGDEEAVYAAMLRLSDSGTAERMGAAARERARLYTWRKVAERLLRALAMEHPAGGRLAEFLQPVT